jgi:aminoglycoside/choline kinase family phosphotransferase
MLSDEEIVKILSSESVLQTTDCLVKRELHAERAGTETWRIAVNDSKGNTHNLFEKDISSDVPPHEVAIWKLMHGTRVPRPRCYYSSFDGLRKAGTILLEDLSLTHDDVGDGPSDDKMVKKVVEAVAALHLEFWDNYDAFGALGLPWRLDSIENWRQHLAALEGDLHMLVEHAQETTDGEQLACCFGGLDYLRGNFEPVLHQRFHKGKHITVIHGDLNPHNVMYPRDDNGNVCFVDFQAARMGLATEDLVMLLSLHLAPNRERSLEYLEHYYRVISESIDDYPFDEFMGDFLASLAEGIFFPVGLYAHRGILDRGMVSNGAEAFRTFHGHD